MDNEKVGSFLSKQREQADDDVQHFFMQFEDFWERKLWHELTDTLVEFYDTKQSEAQRIPIFDNFVKAFADKINQLKLVKLGLNTAAQYDGELDLGTHHQRNGLLTSFPQRMRTVSHSWRTSRPASTNPPHKTPTSTPQ